MGASWREEARALRSQQEADDERWERTKCRLFVFLVIVGGLTFILHCWRDSYRRYGSRDHLSLPAQMITHHAWQVTAIGFEQGTNNQPTERLVVRLDVVDRSTLPANPIRTLKIGSDDPHYETFKDKRVGSTITFGPKWGGGGEKRDLAPSYFAEVDVINLN